MTATLIEPVRQRVVVACDVDTAWRVFTTDLRSWWPTETHALAPGAVTDVLLDGRLGGELCEVREDGGRHAWATVTVWEPPRRLVLAWTLSRRHPPTEIEVVFTPLPADGGTAVELEHRGWEDAAVRSDYETGWPSVLERFSARIARG